MRLLPATAILTIVLLAGAASAHGDLEINELETLAIRDFEGMEDSFPWEGFEIWDVYVGEGYNESYDMDGVYFKVNLAGDGTQRPLGGSVWSIQFQFNVDDETFKREIMHDGSAVTTSFESLQWMVADGNVFQVKAWTPVADIKGRNVTDITIVSAVDGEPRDTAPGGVHTPGAGAEVPVSGPATPVFPPLGEGRIVDAIPLTGPEKFIALGVEPKGNNAFVFSVTNPLKEQGQHVSIHGKPTAGWDMAAKDWGGSLDAQATTELEITIAPRESSTTIEPLRVDVLTDIGGRQTLYAYLEEGSVTLVSDPALAKTSANTQDARNAPAPGILLILAALAALATLRRRG